MTDYQFKTILKNLKSNMDRFIVITLLLVSLTILYLKSNMDRFIDRMYLCISFPDIDLKSNMDRFIE